MVGIERGSQLTDAQRYLLYSGKVGRTVRVFHISDLHGRSEDGPQAVRARREAPLRFRVIRKEWDKNLAALREDGRPVDLVVFTGDLGDWGHETDYAMGVELLRRTCQALDVPLNRLFVVPGNHDIARKTEEAAWKAMRKKLAHAGPPASEWMAGGKPPVGFKAAWRDAVLQRQANFWKAMTELGRAELTPRQHRHRRLGYQVPVPIDGLTAPLWVIGLDTAWLAGDDADTGSLRLTDHQVELLTSGKDGADLPGFRLALMHHRFADLADGERARRLLADRVDMVLHGHQHEAAVEPWASPDHALLVLAAGCLYEGDEHHRYPNACQMIDLELGEDGRPERVASRFRGWAERNGLFWGDDGLLYRSAQHGRLVLRRHNRGWSVDDRPKDPPKPPWQPSASEVFVGRRDELAAIERAITVAPGTRVAVVAVQGMAGVGKSFLVEEFCAQHAGRFGAMCRWVLDPMKPERAEIGLLEIAQQSGIDRDRAPVAAIPALLAERCVLVHVDNVDGAEAAAVVVELLEKLPALPVIVTGRYTALGTTPDARWVRVKVECLDGDAAAAMLRAELGKDAPDEADLRALAGAVGGLPLALHLAAGYLRGGAYSVAGFLARLHAAGLGLEPVDRADPVWRTRSRGVVSVSFQLSKELFLAEATRRGEPWGPALSALGWATLGGFGRELGAAITGLAPGAFDPFIHAATSLSLMRRVPATSRGEVGWSVHPLVAEFLRSEVARTEVDKRIERWVIACGNAGNDDQAARWAALSRESAAVHTWLASVDDLTLGRVLPHCWKYASSHGPVGPWLDAARRVCRRAASGLAGTSTWAWAQLAARVGAHDEVLEAADLLQREGNEERDIALAAGLRADISQARGDLDKALRIHREDELPIYERLGDMRAKATTMGGIASILQTRGELDEALRILSEDALPVYERLGDIRSKAVTMGRIADILQVRGELDEALRIRREDELPIYERLGDVREKAVTMGRIADILQIRGELDEVLRIHRHDELPIYERLGEAWSIAVTMGKIADVLQARGELDEALRIRRQDQLTIFDRLGDVRTKAVTMGKIADIYQARGELDEALRIRRENELPVFESLGDVRSKAMTMGKIADIHQARGELDEALRIRCQELLPVFSRLGDVRSIAVTMGQIADIHQARGELDEALRIHREYELPTFDRLGDAREKAMTMGRIADIHQARGELDDALRIRCQDELPVFERLGDMREKAVTMAKIAGIHQVRGEFDDALRICRQDVLQVFERLGGRDLVFGLVNIGSLLIQRGLPVDLQEARGHLERAMTMATTMRIPFPDHLHRWLASSAGRN